MSSPVYGFAARGRVPRVGETLHTQVSEEESNDDRKSELAAALFAQLLAQFCAQFDAGEFVLLNTNAPHLCAGFPLYCDMPPSFNIRNLCDVVP
ncbi:MAG: hypothetical protein LBG89_01860 [Rickettsiales bacterium]|jgi:hypothetical protein|nr:hypothetical protein [Rickettsiales bacterium]